MTGRLNLRSVGRLSGRPGSSSVSDSNASKSSFRKRKEWSRLGVSEIIGNLLILAITVTLFTGILYFVSSMPGPQEKLYTDFVSNTNLNSDGSAWINITHKGGQNLLEPSTNIYLFKDNTPITLHIANSTTPLGQQWTIGATWTYKMPGINASTLLSVMIVDTSANTVVYSAPLLGNTQGGMSPIIGARGFVQSPVYSGQQVQFFAEVTDPVGKLDTTSIYVNASVIGLGTIPLYYASSISAYVSFDMYPASLSWNGATVIFSASDENGQNSQARYVISVLPSTNGDNNSGGNGAPPENLNFNQMQGMNIFRYSDWKVNNYSATPTRHFNQTEEGVIVVASKFLVNLNNVNEIFIINPITKEIYPTASSPTIVFQSYDYFSGYYVYYAKIEVPQLPNDSNYIIQVQIRDTWLPNNNIFFATDMISVGTPNQATISTYSDPACTVPSIDFNTSSIIYVKVTDSHQWGWNSTSGLVKIADFNGNLQVNRMPGSASPNPVSMVKQSATNLSVYTFSIDLNYANQDPWIPGKNIYSLRYDMFQTSTSFQSDKYLLATNINITAPKILLDMVDGLNGPNVGWASGSIINFYENNNQWVPPDFIQAFSSKHTSTYSVPT